MNLREIDFRKIDVVCSCGERVDPCSDECDSTCCNICEKCFREAYGIDPDSEGR